MGMHHAQNRQPAIRLPYVTAADHLAGTVELNVPHAGIALSPRRQRGQHERLIFLAHAEEHPAGLFLAALPALVSSVLLEKRSADAICYDDALERLIVRGGGRDFAFFRLLLLLSG